MTSSSDGDTPAHFVPLTTIIDAYNGKLLNYMTREDSRNVVVTMPVEVAVKGQGDQQFFVAVAVTSHFESPEALSDEAMRQCSAGHQCLFAWVPMHLYGSEAFSIFIDELGVGENLQNGLVNEVITSAAIEDAVTALAG